jgi:DNA-binding MarR family transcriptional regulator
MITPNILPSDASLATSVILENIVRTVYFERAPGHVQPLQWAIIRYFASCEGEFATVGFAARFLGLSHAPVSRSIETLRQKGLVERQPHPFDGRGSIYKLTKAGEGFMVEDPLVRLALAIDDLPEALRSEFQLAVEKIIISIAV